MNHIETLKQALRALEGIHPGNMTPMAEEAWNKAITALRQAIEQAEQAQPLEQFCWQSPEGTVYQASDDEIIPGSRPVYLTTAPPRQPEQLTDEEIERLVDDEDWYNDPHGFARAIEAKLKEKNA